MRHFNPFFSCRIFWKIKFRWSRSSVFFHNFDSLSKTKSSVLRNFRHTAMHVILSLWLTMFSLYSREQRVYPLNFKALAVSFGTNILPVLYFTSYLSNISIARLNSSSVFISHDIWSSSARLPSM